METRAPHVIVGSFVLLLTAMLVAFAIWIAKVDIDTEYDEYQITFTESVAGLIERGPVLYLGVPVGEVLDIDLNRNNTSQVRVVIKVRTDVPVTEDSIATLAFQGLTGVAVIELTGGKLYGMPIAAQEGEDRPEIPSKVSAFAAFLQAAPELAGQAGDTLAQLIKLMSDENIQNVSAIIENVRSTTANIDVTAANIALASNQANDLMTEVRSLVAQTERTALAIETVANTGDALLQEDAKLLVAEATKTLKTAGDMLANINNMVSANEPAVTQFTTKSLPEVTRMIADLRKAARSLSRLVTRIERNPGEVIFGGDEEEYNLDTRRKEGSK